MAGFELLLVSAIFCTTSAILFLASGRNLKFAEVAEILLYASLSCVFASLLLLTHHFLIDDFSILYVYLNSQREMSPWLKISAVWAGKEGSLLLWNFLNILSASIFLNYGEKDLKKAKAMFVFLSYASTLLILNLFSNPFAELQFRHLNGIGMNPVLRTPEMLVHPPVVFLGYSLVAAVYVSTLFGIQNRKFVISSWILLTVGIILGGFWAYRTLGWGGFWGWDPVENSSLLPWLCLTAYFHIRKGKEFFAYLAMVFVVFTAFVTRSGILSSVHAFASDPLSFFFVVLMASFAIPAFRKWSFEGFCYSPLIFSAMIIVVFLGIITSFFRNVDRSYYLITFVPLFFSAVCGIIYKFIKMKRKLLHFGVILLFLGSFSVWFFEEKRTISVGESELFRLGNLSEEFDGEKLVLRAKIESKYGIFEPEIHFYDNWGRVSKVSIISTPFLDYYLAIRSLSQDSIIIEFYVVPLIILVWLGSVFIIFAGILRLRG